MFSLKNFVLTTLTKMVGKEPDYKVMKYALGWYDKEVLDDDDMLAVQTAIDNQYVTDPEDVTTFEPEPVEQVEE